MHPRLGRRREARRGGAAVEMAFVTPLFVALALGQVEMSRVGMVVQVLETAARQGCRAAIIKGKTASAVRSETVAYLQNVGLSVTSDQVTVADDATIPGAVTVQVSVPYSQVSLLGGVTKFVSASRQLRGRATMLKESF